MFCQIYDDIHNVQVLPLDGPSQMFDIADLNMRHVHQQGSGVSDETFIILRIDPESVDFTGATPYRFTITNNDEYLRVGVYFPGMEYFIDPSNGDGFYIPSAPGMCTLEFYSFYDAVGERLLWGYWSYAMLYPATLFTQDLEFLGVEA